MYRNKIFEKMNLYGQKGISFLFVIDFEENYPIILPLSEVRPSHILFSIRGFENFVQIPAFSHSPLSFRKFPMSYFRYLKAFNSVQSEMIAGNSFLTNLTFPTSIEMNRSLKEIFYASHAPYRLWLKEGVVVFSPEPFVRIAGNEISSFPMKGTIEADIPNASRVLMEDEKEIAEHTTIVDLIRNDLSSVAKEVIVRNFRYIESVPTHAKEILQTSSDIYGTLPLNWSFRLGDIFAKILPAGSISGAPKRKTVEIIRRTEGSKRGYYTGVFGYFDGKSKVESAVMIRFIEKSVSGLLYRSGGGITIYSEAQKEYDEMIGKVYVPIY